MHGGLTRPERRVECMCVGGCPHLPTKLVAVAERALARLPKHGPEEGSVGQEALLEEEGRGLFVLWGGGREGGKWGGGEREGGKEQGGPEIWGGGMW